MATEVIAVGDAELALTDRGSGETVVLLHSLGHRRQMYDEIVEHYLTDYRTVSIDLRGHGDSTLGNAAPSMNQLADDLCGVLESRQIGRAHFVGQSIGAMTILAAATKGHLSGTLFLLDAVAASDDAWDRRYAERVALIKGGGMAAVATEIAETSMGPLTLATRPEVVAAYTGQLSVTPADGYIWACAAMSGFDFRPQLAEIDLPAHLLSGEHDRVAPPDVVRQIAAAMPRSTFTAIPDSGHLPALEQPAFTAALLREWLAVNGERG